MEEKYPLYTVSSYQEKVLSREMVYQMRVLLKKENNKKYMAYYDSDCEVKREGELTDAQKSELSSETQALLKVGFIRDNLAVSDAGSRALIVLLFKENREKLVAIAQAEIEAKKK